MRRLTAPAPGCARLLIRFAFVLIVGLSVPGLAIVGVDYWEAGRHLRAAVAWIGALACAAVVLALLLNCTAEDLP